MKFSKTLLLTIILCTALASPLQAGVKVFLLAGQSNTLGCGGYGDSPAPAPYNTPLADVKLWDHKAPLATETTDQTGHDWVNLSVGYGYGLMDASSWVGPEYDTCFGPELSAGHRLNELYPDDDIYLVKYAVGATSLYEDWNPDGTGPCYNVFKARVNAAVANLKASGAEPELAGMFWLQGSSDAVESNETNHAAENYADNLKAFFNTVRTDFNAPTMPIVVGRYETLWGTPENIGLIRAAHETVPGQIGNATWIDTDGLPKWPSYPPDAKHFNTAGQIELGIRFANAMAAIPEPSTTAILFTGLMAAMSLVWRKRN